MEELFERHSETLFAYLRQHTQSREDAEDILVETFMAALAETKFAHLSTTEQAAWLWRVARNKAVDAFRRARGRHYAPLEQADEVICEDERHNPEQMALRQDEAREMHDLLQHLPAQQQEMLRLRFGHGLLCREIAVIMGKREEAVRTMLSRTMNSLRQLYAQRLSISTYHSSESGESSWKVREMSKERFMRSNEEYFTSEQVDEQIEQLLQQRTPYEQTDEAQLVEALQRTYGVPLMAEDRTALARARQRVMGELSDAHLREYEIPLVSGSEPRPPTHPLHPRRALTRALSALAAVLVVGALLASLLVLTHVTKTPTMSSVAGQDSLYSVRHGVAYRIDGSTGKVVWQRSLPAKQWPPSVQVQLVVSLQVVGSVVYVVSDFDVYALDASNGKPLWHITNQSNTTFYVRFFADNSRVYLLSLYWLSGDYAFSALNSTNGAELWRNTTFKAPKDEYFTVYNGNLYTESTGPEIADCKLYSLDGASGKVRWSLPVCLDRVSVINGIVYFSSSNVLYAVREHDGQKVWERRIVNATYFTDLSITGGVLYANEGNENTLLGMSFSISRAFFENVGKIYAFVAQTGQPLWVSDPSIVMSNLPIKNGLLIIWSHDTKTLSAGGLDVRTGKVVWQEPLMCKGVVPPAWQELQCQLMKADVIDGKLYLLKLGIQPQDGGKSYQLVYTIDSFGSRTGRLLSTHPLNDVPFGSYIIGMNSGLLYVALHPEGTTVLVSYSLNDGKEVWRHMMPPLPPNTQDISPIQLESSEAAIP